MRLELNIFPISHFLPLVQSVSISVPYLFKQETKINRGAGYPSWGISRGSTGLTQLEDRRNVGTSNCNSGEGTDQRVQHLMFMMMNKETRFFSKCLKGRSHEPSIPHLSFPGEW